jgi:hypothetical protein
MLALPPAVLHRQSYACTRIYSCFRWRAATFSEFGLPWWRAACARGCQVTEGGRWHQGAAEATLANKEALIESHRRRLEQARARRNGSMLPNGDLPSDLRLLHQVEEPSVPLSPSPSCMLPSIPVACRTCASCPACYLGPVPSYFPSLSLSYPSFSLSLSRSLAPSPPPSSLFALAVPHTGQ